MLIAAAARLLTLGAVLVAPHALRAAFGQEPQQTAPLSPQARYDHARQLMQRGQFRAAADVYQGVADAGDAPQPLRAQALFVAGLMYQNARDYERAIAIYRDVLRRFPGTVFAKQADDGIKVLEEGGAGRAVEFRRRVDAAWDELTPAQAVVDRDGLRAGRAGLERGAALLEGVVRDFGDHPRIKDVFTALGNTHMTLQWFGRAREDYQRALTSIRQQGAEGPGYASLVSDAEQRLLEAVRAWRRQWATRVAWTVLAAIGVGFVAVQPWRAVDAPLLGLGGGLVLATVLLAGLAMAASLFVRLYVDEHSPIQDRAAGLLVALPGITGEVVALGFVAGLRRTRRWRAPRIAGLAAAVAALAALAVATCVVNAFALFPVLDSMF